jgi:Xaa-Pro dipeptidase
MNIEKEISAIQEALLELKLDAWLFFDHHHRDPIAYRVLGLDSKQAPTRRWFYLIPALGSPRMLVHRIESNILQGLPGEKSIYSGWATLQEGLSTLLAGMKTVAMQFSPFCAIPTVSMVDGGTVDLIRSFGVEVQSSANLIQRFVATLSAESIASHWEAGRRMDRIRAAAFEEIRHRLAEGHSFTEWDMQVWLRKAFALDGLVTDHGPIVATNAHAADPHYEPQAAGSSDIRSGDLILIDMWAKLEGPESVFYDISWTAYAGQSVPSDIENVFQIVIAARDAAFELVRDAFAASRRIQGFEVDDAARAVIVNAGFGDAFVHRTGHSITQNVHGTGANMDNLETHDERLILPNTLFSIEPGIYLERFGIRSEFNVLTSPSAAVVTGEIQRSLLKL